MTDPSRTRNAPEASQVGEPGRLTRRNEYVAVGRGRRFHSTSLSLQSIERPGTDPSVPGLRARFGLTVSRKVGNSVVRSRVKRRLREAIRLVERAAAGEAGAPALLPPGLPAATHDYVVVAREGALTLPFDRLLAELAADIAGVHQGRRSRDGSIPSTGQAGRPHRRRGQAPAPSETR